MTPAAAIAMLDRQIAMHGTPVVVKRGAAALSVRAMVRNYKPTELVAGMEQGDTDIVFSPTPFAGTPFADGPKAGDHVTIAGRVRSLKPPEPVAIGATVVRYNVRARG